MISAPSRRYVPNAWAMSRRRRDARDERIKLKPVGSIALLGRAAVGPGERVLARKEPMAKLRHRC